MSANISIIIITYNRPQDLQALVENIAALNHPELLHEVVIINNASSESYASPLAFMDVNAHIPWRYELVAENLGVSRGRNYAITKSSGEFLVFLDDDAYFASLDALSLISSIMQEPDAPGILAMKVMYESTREMQQTAFPHKDFSRLKDAHQFKTYYYAGCAHLICRDVILHTGLYPEDFFYGMEEYDLSYRALSHGYIIKYDDRLVVWHKESPEGRLTPAHKLKGMWINKSKVAWKYLPVWAFYSTAFMWSFQYLRKTRFDFKGWFQGWQGLMEIPSSVKRQPLNRKALQYLDEVRARLWY